MLSSTTARTQLIFSRTSLIINNNTCKSLPFKRTNYRWANNNSWNNTTSPSTTWRRYLRRIDPDTAVRSIIAANVLVFTSYRFNLPFSNDFVHRHFIASTSGVWYGRKYYTLLTAFFSHINEMHLFGNMLTFWFFGRDVFRVLGTPLGVALYLTAGVMSTAAQTYSGIQMRTNIHVLGASGAVAAMVVYNVATWPSSMVYLYGVLPIPAFVFGMIFVASDLYGASGHPSTFAGGALVGHQAHLAGAAVGMAAWVITRGRVRYY